MTIDEFLVWELQQSERHEFWEGEVFSQDEARVEQHSRTADGLWLLREVVGIDQTIQLASLDMPLAMRDVYDKAELS